MDLFSTSTLSAPADEEIAEQDATPLVEAVECEAPEGTETQEEDDEDPSEPEENQETDSESKEEGEEEDDAGQEEGEEPEEKDEGPTAKNTNATKPAEKKKEKPPRLPYEWGKCPTIITIRLAPVEAGRQKVRMAVATHEQPMEPPVMQNFEVSEVPPGLSDEFLGALREQLTVAIAEVIKEFPDRQKTWEIAPDDAERHVPNYTPAAKSATQKAIKGKAGGKQTAKKAPPDLPKGQVSLFG